MTVRLKKSRYVELADDIVYSLMAKSELLSCMPKDICRRVLHCPMRFHKVAEN